ncbi:hypothetical protein [Egicoccus halophilus]|uniref:Uncharacterized protein n=1 Tax=Egicoccus halophilus TaxID=1670830 RepID=A0A8J3AAD3_9ACTN|nr:hypothetical protein [Egicoccus halophilus]GGI08492.1 hypothetical protein GCM10011354_29350 [Egicoccus halophilus]
MTATARRARDDRRRDVLAAAALLLVLAVLYLATASRGPAQVNDTRAATVASWSLGTRGDPALPSAWPPSHNYWGTTAPDGRVFVNRFPGVAYWAAPAYALASLGDQRPAPAHPFLVDRRPAGRMAAITAALAAVGLFAVLRTVTGRRPALLGAGLFGLGTSLWSVAADALWPHAPACLALAGVLLGWRRQRPVVAAAAAGVAVLVRPHLVVAIGVLALVAWRDRERRASAAMTAGAGLGLALLSAYSWWAFGTLLPVAGYDTAGHLGGLVDHSPWQTLRAFALALVGTERGVLRYSPVVAGALVALLLARRRVPGWALGSALAGLVYLFVQVRAVGHRGGAHFFAYRVTLEPLLLATPALVAASVAAVREHRWVGPVLGLLGLASVGIHGFGAVVGGIDATTTSRWEHIDRSVREAFGDRELGEVDLRPRP